MKLDGLTEHEALAFEWQYGYMGGFHSSLMETIARADDENIKKLAVGFPAEVLMYQLFTQQSGWWENVIKKCIKLKYLKSGGV